MRGNASRRAGAIAVAITLAATWAGAHWAARPAGAATSPLYYVAMGDSLGAGAGASPGSNAYVNRIYQHELARIPGLQLHNISCGGATTGSVLNGPGCGSTTQIEQAKAFLKAHAGHVAFLTIDIGGNDVAGCNAAANSACLTNALNGVRANLPRILSALKSAYPAIRVFGTDYYDPFLASWLSGPSGQTAAQRSAAESDAFNSILADLYGRAGFPTADVGSRFQTGDFSLTGTYNGQTVPLNVANVCNWTHQCDSGDFHANNTGHGVMADAFTALIDAAAAPAAPTAVTAVPGNASATVRWTRPAFTGTAAITGFVVTPYLGSTAQPAHTFATAPASAVVRGLTNAKRYTFKVAATNSVGTGPNSGASKPITPGTPSAARSVSATPVTGGARVHWTAPATGNGSKVAGYIVTPALNGVARPATTFAPTATTQTVRGLTRGKTYTFRVAAKNARGIGPQSGPSNAVKIP